MPGVCHGVYVCVCVTKLIYSEGVCVIKLMLVF